MSPANWLAAGEYERMKPWHTGWHGFMATFDEVEVVFAGESKKLRFVTLL